MAPHTVPPRTCEHLATVRMGDLAAAVEGAIARLRMMPHVLRPLLVIEEPESGCFVQLFGSDAEALTFNVPAMSVAWPCTSAEQCARFAVVTFRDTWGIADDRPFVLSIESRPLESKR